MLRKPVDIASTSEEYVEDQHQCGQAVFEFYLKGRMDQMARPRILDVGCGVGKSVMASVNAGFDAYGVDLPNLAPFWAAAKNPGDRFVEVNATRLPFADNYFDFIYSFGVIEHIGTLNGFGALAPDYKQQRYQYAQEMLRVAKPGGRILVACPNKSFPIDIQHGPGDPIEPAGRFRSYIFKKTGMNLHKTWGRNHLLSYPEVRSLFAGGNGNRQFTALPLNNYFQFGRFKRGFLKPFGSLAEIYVNHMPARVRRSFLNPYVMAEIRK
jgi:SAM-dependent methyltransferase